MSRQWKAATAAEWQKLIQRPVPSELVALLIFGPYFRKECLIVALGVDKQGQKHVLGLWHGATENSTLVRELLADLRERGLNTEAALLVVLDGAKMVLRWGAAALLFAEKGFRRVRGYDHISHLIDALQAANSNLASMKKAA